ncbi:hypothetical protein C8T65DRAFT_831710 [Cerioporus squamosus]|nr:hypothetical protein C8T65DRAFT_831710 [Cerioporus squamosus]
MSKKRPLEEPVAGPSSKIRRLDGESEAPTPYIDLKSNASPVGPAPAASRASVAGPSKQSTATKATRAAKSIPGLSLPSRHVPGIPGLSMPRRSSPPRAFKVRGLNRRLKHALVSVPPSSTSTVAPKAHNSAGSTLSNSPEMPAPQRREKVVLKAPVAGSSDDAPVGYPCSSCGDYMFTDSWDKCTMCELRALSRKDVPPKETRPALVPAINATNAVASSSAVLSDTQPKPRHRVTKKMREREFRTWFSNWTQAYRERPELRTDTEDKTDYWRDEQTRKEGGTVYQTVDDFFAALQRAWINQQIDKARGGTQVVEFYGAYSIVAQPRINAHNRHEKIRERMRQMGFELDPDNFGKVYFKRRKSDDELTVTDNVFKYPCSCGGSSPPPGGSPPQKHRAPDAQYVGPCGGTVMILVGRDDALRPYHRIDGQRIAVDIVH